MLISVLIAEDSDVYRYGLAACLQTFDDIAIKAIVGNGTELLQAATADRPDVVLTDVALPRMDATALCRELQLLYPGLPVVVIASAYKAWQMRQLQEAGVCGYLSKECTPFQLATALRQAYGGGDYYCASSKEALALLRETEKVLKLFSPTHLKVIQLLCLDKNTREIASLLGLTHQTVGFYRKELLRKCNATTVQGVVMFAARWSLDRLELGVEV